MTTARPGPSDIANLQWMTLREVGVGEKQRYRVHVDELRRHVKRQAVKATQPPAISARREENLLGI